jgi:DNA-binding XRE family transcriptional regulator
MTIIDLAKETELATATISHAETGKHFPRRATQKVLAMYFNCDVADLFPPTSRNGHRP